MSGQSAWLVPQQCLSFLIVPVSISPALRDAKSVWCSRDRSCKARYRGKTSSATDPAGVGSRFDHPKRKQPLRWGETAGPGLLTLALL